MKSLSLSPLTLLNADRRMIMYRPELNKFIGNTNATLLFQQCCYLYEKFRYKPFYYFDKPCANEYYKQDCDWSNTLGITTDMLRTARKLVAQRVQPKNHSRVEFEKPIIYWRDGANHLTYYMVDQEIAARWVYEAYQDVDRVVTPTPKPVAEKDNLRLKIIAHYSDLLGYEVQAKRINTADEQNALDLIIKHKFTSRQIEDAYHALAKSDFYIKNNIRVTLSAIYDAAARGLTPQAVVSNKKTINR